MLTKDLLKYRIRAGLVYPVFIAPDNAEALQVAEQLVDVAQSCVGLARAEFEERLQGEVDGDVPSMAGLKKILFDRCTFENDSGSVEELRWARIVGAQALRNQCEFATVSEYQQAVAAHFDAPFEQIADTLYSDLPDYRRLTDASEVLAADLINRYNCGQVQGLLLSADALVIKLKAPTIAMQRSFFRSLKFHQLIVSDLREEGSAAKKDLEVRIDGPMSIFEHSGMYGTKFANFFPRVLHFPKWEICADLKVKHKAVRLVLTEKSKIISYMSQTGGYVPEELDKFVSAFNSGTTGWIADIGGNFIDLGKQEHCVSDLSFRQKNGAQIEVELFHKWHAGQLPKRLELLEKTKKKAMLIGVSQNLAKSSELSGLLNNSSWFAKNGFVFKDFPTTRQVLEVLARADF